VDQAKALSQNLVTARDPGSCFKSEMNERNVRLAQKHLYDSLDGAPRRSAI
jgi:hypothetical protein